MAFSFLNLCSAHTGESPAIDELMEGSCAGSSWPSS